MRFRALQVYRLERGRAMYNMDNALSCNVGSFSLIDVYHIKHLPDNTASHHRNPNPCSEILRYRTSVLMLIHAAADYKIFEL